MKKLKNPLTRTEKKKLSLEKFANDIASVIEGNRYTGYTPTEKLEVILKKCNFALKGL